MKSNKNISIGKVELEINDKVIRLSLGEAKELKNILDELFPQPTYIPSQPIYYNPNPWRYWEPYYTTCGGSIEADNTLRLTCSN